MATLLTAATKDINAGEAGTAAKLLSTENDNMTSIESAAVTAKNTWVTLGQTTVKKFTTWIASPETYTTVGDTTKNCDGTAGTEVTVGVDTLVKC